MIYDTIIIGGGAAGLAAAGFCAGKGENAIVIERNERCARKVMITGKGRCNVTNDSDLNGLINAVPVNGRFLYSAFSKFGSSDTMELFERLGVPLKVERGNRVFPVSDKAVDIVDALVKFATQSGSRIVRGRVESLILDGGAVKGVRTHDGREFFAEKVIIATGGLSYPVTGSDGDGYNFAVQAGHTVTELKPSLVPLVARDGFCSRLQGLSLKNVAVKVFDKIKNTEVYSDFGEMMFTHFGLTGPVILSASSHMRNMEKGRYQVIIDLKPALTADQLDSRIQRDFLKFVNRDFINSLSELLPNKMIPVMVRLSGIKPSCKVNQITREQRMRLGELIKNFTVNIEDFRPIEEAIITSGGVKVSEISPKNMESKIVKGLHFAGEVIDVDAYTGGFNLQIAFSTAYAAAEAY